MKMYVSEYGDLHLKCETRYNNVNEYGLLSYGPVYMYDIKLWLKL